MRQREPRGVRANDTRHRLTRSARQEKRHTAYIRARDCALWNEGRVYINSKEEAVHNRLWPLLGKFTRTATNVFASRSLSVEASPRRWSSVKAEGSPHPLPPTSHVGANLMFMFMWMISSAQVLVMYSIGPTYAPSYQADLQIVDHSRESRDARDSADRHLIET